MNTPPSELGRTPIAKSELKDAVDKLDGWRVVDGPAIRKSIESKDFETALATANAVGEIAAALDHHPSLRVEWGKLEIEIGTHDVGGVTEFDLEFAKRVNEQFG